MVRPERFELPAFWFVARRSIQLSYGRISFVQLLFDVAALHLLLHYCIGAASFPFRGLAPTGASAVV
jgi:hypothetical protein